MKRSTRQFVAVIIALWLPLFSGNALAVSVAMQAATGESHAVAMQEAEHCMHHAMADMHPQSAGDDALQSGDVADSQEPSCASSGICHLACSGYLAAASFEVAKVLPLAQAFSPAAAQFESAALTLLDPPPLART